MMLWGQLNMKESSYWKSLNPYSGFVLFISFRKSVTSHDLCILHERAFILRDKSLRAEKFLLSDLKVCFETFYGTLDS